MGKIANRLVAAVIAFVALIIMYESFSDILGPKIGPSEFFFLGQGG
jgi:hypothetical protein